MRFVHDPRGCRCSRVRAFAVWRVSPATRLEASRDRAVTEAMRWAPRGLCGPCGSIAASETITTSGRDRRATAYAACPVRSGARGCGHVHASMAFRRPVEAQKVRANGHGAPRPTATPAVSRGAVSARGATVPRRVRAGADPCKQALCL